MRPEGAGPEATGRDPPGGSGVRRTAGGVHIPSSGQALVFPGPAGARLQPHLSVQPQPESPSGAPAPRVHSGQATPLRAGAHMALSFTGKEPSETEVLWEPSLVTEKK